MATKQSKSKSHLNNVMLLGTTTLRRMVRAAFDENDLLHSLNININCFEAQADIEDNPELGDEVVYLYYHPKDGITIMTTVKGDLTGTTGSSASFKGKVLLFT